MYNIYCINKLLYGTIEYSVIQGVLIRCRHLFKNLIEHFTVVVVTTGSAICPKEADERTPKYTKAVEN